MSEHAVKDAILIAGPTASGKSALALHMAKKTGGFIVNTDSMQVYDVLDLLSARPQPDELREAEHYLYGHVPLCFLFDRQMVCRCGDLAFAFRS